MENPFNFGGPPSTHLFWYQAGSALYEDETSYPPTPGTVVGATSLAQNISNLTVYMTYDELDAILHVPHINDDLFAYLASVGNTATLSVQSGTVYPPIPSILVPHSWYVLDETEIFDAMDGVTVNRLPSSFYSRQEEGGRVSYITTTQDTVEQLVSADCDVNTSTQHITLANVQNATEVEVNIGDAGITTFPVRVTATSADSNGFRLKVTGFSASPSRMYILPSKDLMTGVDSEPSTGSLLVDVPPNSTLDVSIQHDPTWTTVPTSSSRPHHCRPPSSACSRWMRTAMRRSAPRCRTTRC